MKTYNYVDGLVQIDDDTFLVDNRNSADPSLAEHMHYIEYTSSESRGSDRMVRVVALRIDISPNAKRAQRDVKVNNVTALENMVG